MERYLMIFWYLVNCLKLAANPWRFFQLNADYFNRRKGIFSKNDINRLIPVYWRLEQNFDHESFVPSAFPVFLKPEWGQNSYGIYRADSPEELQRLRQKTAASSLTYLVQEAARESREFEVFYIRDVSIPGAAASLTVTEVINHRESRFPINGIHNENCVYLDRTSEFSDQALNQLWDHISSIGFFRIARVAIKADSEEDLINGRFHIVEINLFTPMPLQLLDRRKTWAEKLLFIRSAMYHLAANTADLVKKEQEEPIFFKKLIMHYRVKP